jgi:hypothetical protein
MLCSKFQNLIQIFGLVVFVPGKNYPGNILNKGVSLGQSKNDWGVVKFQYKKLLWTDRLYS